MQRVLAPAKVNLYLRVVGRRNDGYHLLDSLMAPVDLFDELTVTVRRASRREVTVECDGLGIAGGPSNLVYRAAEVFLERTSIAAEVSIQLRKRIPGGSGLGGGSSDAATTLIVLNRLFAAGCAVKELAAWAAEIGADVPFFVYGCPAHVEGIGEIVTPLAGWAGIALVIAFDGSSLSTRAIYERFDIGRTYPGASLTKRPSVTSIPPFAGSRVPLRELLVNDLEAVAGEIHPGVGSLKQLLLQLGADGALMTGSGSAVFGVWPTRSAAEEAARVVRSRGIWAVAVETIELSPAAE